MMNGKELIKLLIMHGWKVERVKASHYQMLKPGHRTIPVPVHVSKDLPKGLVKAI